MSEPVLQLAGPDSVTVLLSHRAFVGLLTLGVASCRPAGELSLALEPRSSGPLRLITTNPPSRAQGWPVSNVGVVLGLPIHFTSSPTSNKIARRFTTAMHSSRPFFPCKTTGDVHDVLLKRLEWLRACIIDQPAFSHDCPAPMP